MIHESARYSATHEHWFFLPRKASRRPYDEIADTSKCVNLMLAAPDSIGAEPGGGGDDVVHMQSYLSKLPLRGCSDFLFVPGTNDCHIFLIRTEEALDGTTATYAAVIDLEGRVLMEEVAIAQSRKFEGVAWVSGFGHFPAAAVNP